MMGRPWRLLLCGAGNVGAGLLAMIDHRRLEIITRYGVDLRVCGIAEEGGCAVDPRGLDIGAVSAALRSRTALGALPEVGRPGMTAREMVTGAEVDIVLDATPVNLANGEPGLGAVRSALDRGAHVVTANKGPLALAFGELAGRSDIGDGWGTVYRPPESDERRPRLRFSAAVAGALPVINIGRRDLLGDRIIRVEAVFNGTSMSILRAMEDGRTFDDAMADATRRGIVEADPSLDIDGLDAACKLVITANAVLGVAAALKDVAITGIREVTHADLIAAAGDGDRIVPLCRAESDGDNFRLAVGPTALPDDHPLARLTPDEMGVVYYTEHLDRLYGVSLEPGAGPASAAMLRDILDIVWSENR